MANPLIRKHAGLIALIAFLIVWALRATVLYRIDEAIPGGVPRSLYATGVKFALWVVPAWCFARWVRRQPPLTYLGIATMPPARAWGIATLMTAVYMAAVISMELAVAGKSLAPTWTGMLPLAFLAASCFIEEILFRGLILRELDARWHGALANVGCSLLFVGVHLPYWFYSRGLGASVIADGIGVFLVSLLFGAIYLRTRSVWPCFVAHVLNNLISSWLVLG